MSSPIETVMTLRRNADGTFLEGIERWNWIDHPRTLVEKGDSGRSYALVYELDFADVHEDPSLILFERRLLLIDVPAQKVRCFERTT